ncbi:hypothetical protein [Pseudothioclava arenosa]|uniref:Phasin domain-containing protein n=1 Tax=Pseudothioclava arenosa TaxID=1795308 RepID=A0A2A4CRI0_9RHOB|nr:hypothetical protein [Pseudothioclava arenosa]PCD76749.1 hypothetical protein CLN94_06480 [Pseudothioclava arenosa]
MVKKTETKTGMAGVFAVPDDIGLGMVNKMLRPQMAMAQAIIDQHIETLEFLKTRFERDREMLGVLSQTVDPVQAATLWSEFWQRSASDYAMESAKLSTSLQHVTEQAIKSATEESEAIAQAMTGKS